MKISSLITLIALNGGAFVFSQSESIVSIDGLTNEEKVNLPKEAYSLFADINEKLKNKLSPDDYTEIIKEEAAWASQSFQQPDLILKNLQKILEHPDDERTFRRPHFVTTEQEGTNFVHDVFNSLAELRSGDNDYLISCTELEDGSLLSFWDAHTCKLTSTLNVPDFSDDQCTLWKSKQGAIYLTGSKVEYPTNSPRPYVKYGTWMYSGHIELISPKDRNIQILTVGDVSKSAVSFGFYNPKNGLLAQKAKFNTSGYINKSGSKSIFDIEHADEVNTGFTRISDADNSLSVSTLPSLIYNAWRRDPYTVGKPKARRILQTENHNGKTVLAFNYRGNRRVVIDPHNLRQLISNQIPGEAERDHILVAPENIILKSITGHAGLFPYFDTVKSADGSRLFTCLSERTSIDYATHDYSRYAICGIITGDNNVLYFKNLPFSISDGSPISYWGDFSGAKGITGQLIEKKALPKELEGREYQHTSTLYWRFRDTSVYDIAPVDICRLNDGTYDIFLQLGRYLCRILVSPKDSTYSITDVWNKTGFAFIRDLEILATSTEDEACIALWKCQENKDLQFIANLYIDPDLGYAIVLPDGTYTGTPGCERFLMFKQGETRIGMKALAPWKNNPAAVLEALGGDSQTIEILRDTRSRWLTRMKKSGKEQLPALPQFPTVELLDPELFSGGQDYSFSVNIEAKEKPITDLSITMDSVPVKAEIRGLPVPAGEKRKVEVSVSLVQGQNWISLSPVEEGGLTGDTTRFRVICQKQLPTPTTHIIALGVSEYDNPELKLEYAAKDASDITEAFRLNNLNKSRILLLQNSQVTRDVMKTVSEFSSHAKPEDTVVLYIAGHGLLNGNLDYFYAPATADIEDPEGTCIPMKEITQALVSTSARNRLLMLDTCHAGSLGEEGSEKMAMGLNQLPQGVRAVQTRGLKIKGANPAKSQEQRRFIEEFFNMEEADQGINVIAASGGAEFAQESGEWKNGVFTSCVLAALSGRGDADTDRDGFVSIQELQNYVTSRVFALTSGAQSPSCQITKDARFSKLATGLFGLRRLSGRDHLTGLPRYQWDKLVEKLRTMTNLAEDNPTFYLAQLYEYGAPTALLKELLRLGCHPYQYAMGENERPYTLLSKAILDPHPQRIFAPDAKKTLELLLRHSGDPLSTRNIQMPTAFYRMEDASVVQLLIKNNVSPCHIIDAITGNINYWDINPVAVTPAPSEVLCGKLHRSMPFAGKGASPSEDAAAMLVKRFILTNDENLFSSNLSCNGIRISRAKFAQVWQTEGTPAFIKIEPQGRENKSITIRASYSVLNSKPRREKSSSGSSKDDPVELADKRMSEEEEYIFTVAVSNGSLSITGIKDLTRGKRIEQSNLAATLYNAAIHEDTETLDRLKEEKASYEAKDETGATALMKAVKDSSYYAVELLIEHGADINARNKFGETALFQAVEADDYKAADFLLGAKANPDIADNTGATPLLAAADSGNTRIIKLLLSHGASPAAVDSDNRSPLLLAAARGQAYAVEELLSKGADVHTADSRGNRPLIEAVKSDSEEIVNRLLAAGASVNETGYLKVTPLMIAAGKGNNSLVAVLLNHGADVNAVSGYSGNTGTALIDAISKGHQYTVDLLLKKGASPNLTGVDETPPIVIAVSENNSDSIASLLLEYGADPTIPDEFEKSAYDIATERGMWGLLQKMRNKTKAKPQLPDNEEDASVTDTSSDGNDLTSGALQQITRVQNLTFNTSLERAYQKRVIELLQKIANGAPIDTRLDAARNNTTALHNACAICDLELVQWLVANGADLNARAKNGATPYVCVGEDRVKGPIVRKWIKQAQANPSSVSRTATQPAATSSSSLAAGARQQLARVQGLTFNTSLERAYQKRVIELLQKIANGAPIDTRLDAARNNTTALHNACAICDLELVQWLVANGADLNARAKNGATPYVCVGEDRVKGPIVRKWIKQAQANRR